MKKVILSAILFLTFGFFIVFKRQSDIQNMKSVTVLSELPENIQKIPENKYKDGKYIGNSADAYYGRVQVGAVISQGKITEVNILKYPDERQNSTRLNKDALPQLQKSAITIQNANVDCVSGASLTCAAFQESLANILAQAKI